MKNKPDNRENNVERIERNISNTIRNTHLADEMIEKTSDDKMVEELKKKNRRRDQALHSMRQEIRDEAIARRQGYKD